MTGDFCCCPECGECAAHYNVRRAKESGLVDELRRTANDLRTKSIPLKDLIPILQKAADALSLK